MDELLQELANTLTVRVCSTQGFFITEEQVPSLAKADMWRAYDLHHEVGKILLGYLNAPPELRTEIDFIGSDNVR